LTVNAEYVFEIDILFVASDTVVGEDKIQQISKEGINI